MHYLITGGAGFIGSHLVEMCLQRDHAVTVLDDFSTGQVENIAPFRGQAGFRFINDAITNEAVVERLAAETDIIVHLAATVGVQLVMTRKVQTIESNVLGTERVLKAASRYGTKVLLASTSEVYGKGNGIPFREDDDIVLGPTSVSRWAYAASKMVDEFLGLAYWQEYALPVVVFRLFNTVGPRQTGRYGMVIPRLVQQALYGEPLTIFGDGMQRRCFCDVRDVVQALMSLATHPQAVGQVFNIGGCVETTIQGLAERILGVTGSASTITFVPYETAYGPGFEDMRRRVPDISRISTLVGWKPSITLDETLMAITDSFRMLTGSDGRVSPPSIGHTRPDELTFKPQLCSEKVIESIKE
ncbi:MAG TPA: NAD-dependent epimerase/dehydratase family protein [Ktedonobacteraceae bacterium]|nr:NAD-dependent epimerase/dehydratase family protein [Ktedonobacteraceae bacterium]